jgi:hypothetical protein
MDGPGTGCPVRHWRRWGPRTVWRNEASGLAFPPQRSLSVAHFRRSGIPHAWRELIVRGP